MKRATMLWPAMLLLFVAGACEPRQAPDRAPQAAPAELGKRAVFALLPGLQFGPDPARDAYRDIRAADVAGMHFVPGANRWVVHYCADFTSFASDAPLRRCDVNVEIYQLDTKKWVGLARGAGTLYRWQVLELEAEHASRTPAKTDTSPPAP